MALLPYAVVAMIAALILYSIGVWSERIARHLKLWHLFFFLGGLACDTVGTELMHRIAGGVFTLSLHSLTGLLALFLMAAHAIWALVVLIRKREKELRTFHYLSLVVWILWLIPFTTGAVLNSSLVHH
ncbi:MAG TPA: HsmA family protein [Ktedonosporobacter sp.]|nr:HsmA family protein [Ktedonosporobacter sp.]